MDLSEFSIIAERAVDWSSTDQFFIKGRPVTRLVLPAEKTATREFGLASTSVYPGTTNPIHSFRRWYGLSHYTGSNDIAISVDDMTLDFLHLNKPVDQCVVWGVLFTVCPKKELQSFLQNRQPSDIDKDINDLPRTSYRKYYPQAVFGQPTH